MNIKYKGIINKIATTVNGNLTLIHCQVSEIVVDDMDLVDDMDKKMLLFLLHIVHIVHSVHVVHVFSRIWW